MMPWERVTAQPDALGESPFWHSEERRLYWVDIPGRQIRRLAAAGVTESWPMPSEPGCIAPVRGGGLIVALRDGIYRAAAWRAPLACVVRFSHDTKVIRFNDGKADPEGRFWAGTIYEPRDGRKAELYSIDLRPGHADAGRPIVQVKAINATVANGLAWSPDAKTLYWADTTQHAIYAWDWDADSNVMRHHRVLREFPRKPAGWSPGMSGYGGRPDGAAVDQEGNYWCAMMEGARLLKLSPAGETLGEIELPVRCPTMPAFGGDDLRTLYVTTAREKRPLEELQAMPWSGHVIATRVDVPGLPVNFASA